MARFCFNANHSDADNILKEFFDRVNVDFELDACNPRECCVILKDPRDKGVFLNLCDRLEDMLLNKGFSRPLYVPKWKSIKHIGPYFNDSIPYYKSELRPVKNVLRRVHVLSPLAETYAFLYAGLCHSRLPVDETFRLNFWQDFQAEAQSDFQSLEEIDWSHVISNYRKKLKRENDTVPLPNKHRHSFVEIDGRQYSAIPFAVDEASLYFGQTKDDVNRGRIRPAIKRSDVILNLSKDFVSQLDQVGSYQEIVFKPGTCWAAKWKPKFNHDYKYMEIYFNRNPNEDDFYENFDDIEAGDGEDDDGDDIEAGDDDDGGGDDSGGDDDEGDDSGFELAEEEGLVAGLDRLGVQGIGPGQRPKYFVPPKIEDRLDFSDTNIPLTYIVSNLEQWRYVSDACQTNFNQVGNLGKVSNAKLQLIADAAALALQRRSAPTPSLNDQFIYYANQRYI